MPWIIMGVVGMTGWLASQMTDLVSETKTVDPANTGPGLLTSLSIVAALGIAGFAVYKTLK